MADDLSELTEAKWDALKKGAKIPDTNIFKALLGGAASVGSAISAYQKSRAEWKNFKGVNSVLAYTGALGKLDAAFSKFATIKEFKNPEAKTLKTAIEGWQREARAKKAKVEQFAKDNLDALKANDAAGMIKKLGDAGLM